MKSSSSKPPVLVTEYGYRQNSSSFGRWHGGNGTIRECQMTRGLRSGSR
ncbi:MAG: hypothetical protein F4Y40_01305 [Acidimicrobiia bacterium]|nr:hypothetical protein [Acidimicrobiia bacterium]